VVITVYVPTNYVFSSPTLIKVVVHETTTKTTIIKTRKVYEPCPPGQKLNPETDKCVNIPICNPGQHLIFVGTFICVPSKLPYIFPPPSTCDSKYYTGPCPPTDPNAYLKCASAAIAANDLLGE
jgi:hypothetical protein